MIRPSSEVPVRPDAPGGVGRPGRRWLPAGLVALVISVTVLGGFVVAETLPQPEVRPVALGGVLTIRPLSGWELVRRQQATVPLPSGGALSTEFAQLTRGSGALDLLAIPGFGGTALELSDLYVGEVLTSQLERLRSPIGWRGSCFRVVWRRSVSDTSDPNRAAARPSRDR